MILQALCSYYNHLAAAGKIPPVGWESIKIGYVLNIDADGNIESIVSFGDDMPSMNVPVGNNATSGIEPRFLADKAKYILGLENKGNNSNPDVYSKHFEASKALHIRILKGVNSECAQAVINYFKKQVPSNEVMDETIKEYPGIYDDKGKRIVFRVGGKYVHEDKAIIDAWNQYEDKIKTCGRGLCLVTGKESPIIASHPNVKGFAGAQSSGAYVVSFNAPAFCSYGFTQGENARTGVDAALEYGLALNYLKDNFRIYAGETMVLCWADSPADEYINTYNSLLIGREYSENSTKEDSLLTENAFRQTVKELCKGHCVNITESALDPKTDFYVLGLAPNAGRLSVQFFYHNSYGDMITRAYEHQDRLSIIGINKLVSMNQIIAAVTNPASKDKKVPSVIVRGILESILNNARYPAYLINGVMRRIRAEKEVTPVRAGIIKAYYLKANNPFVPKEVLTMALNEESTNIPYNLGRLFATLESVQYLANSSVNASIKDKFFNAAAEKPAMVFARLLELSEKHQKKLKNSGRGGIAVFYNKQIQGILSNIGESFPERLNLAQQGSFMLGYYHQRKESMKKSENDAETKENNDAEE